MKRHILIIAILFLGISKQSTAQIDLGNFDLKNLDIKDILGKVMKVDKGFSPDFFLGNLKIPKIPKVAEILGMKKNPEIDKLFKTFRTGRTIFHIASYSGTAVALYGAIKSLGDSVKSADYKAELIGGLTSALTGLIVKLLTKGASYKAVDIFNGIAARKIKDIFSIKPASNGVGIGLYVKLD